MPTSAAATALALTDEQRAAGGLEIALAQIERLADPQARPPKHDDQRADAVAMQAAARLTHHGDDLLDPWQVRRVVHSFVPRGAAEVKFGGRGR